MFRDEVVFAFVRLYTLVETSHNLLVENSIGITHSSETNKPSKQND